MPDFNFPGLQAVVRVINTAGEVVTFFDSETQNTRFLRIVETVGKERLQVVELSDVGAFVNSKTVTLSGEGVFDLWPDVKARFFFDRDRTTWRTCFFVKPSVKVNRLSQRRSARDKDAIGPDLPTATGKIEGRRAVNEMAGLITSRSKWPQE